MITHNEHALVIIGRHGECTGNVAGLGMAELETSNHRFPLTELGTRQVEAMKKHVLTLCDGHPSLAYASTMLRSQQSASPICGSTQKLNIDSRLDERWDGILHSLPRHRLEAYYEDELALRKKYGWYHHRTIGGENGPDVEMRIRCFRIEVWDWISKLSVGTRVPTVFISGHGNWMLLNEGLVHGWTAEEINRRKQTDQIPNGCISTYKVYSPFEWYAVNERYVPDPSLVTSKNSYA